MSYAVRIPYGAYWPTGLCGAAAVGGPTISQACATSVRGLLAATQEIQAGLAIPRWPL